MAYRSIKRALLETSLERKCRILFFSSLLLLIGTAFWFANWQAESLVFARAHQNARDWVNMYLLDYHWEHWVAENEEVAFQNLRTELKQDLLKKEHIEGYEAQLLALDQTDSHYLNQGMVPEDPDELALLHALKRDYDMQVAALKEQAAQRIHTDEQTFDSPVKEHDGFVPVFAERKAQHEGSYYFYQPVFWNGKSCKRCHYQHHDDTATTAEPVAAVASDLPFRVVKVIMPYEKTKKAITSTRAILITTAIVTVFLAMIALYIIVRYVIAKPLAHLRDVADEITRGNTELRADISTNDEFEKLANAFNRMLRHLTGTQTELRQLNVELDAKVDELAQLNMQLYEMNRLKDDFLANMSHELRTPLNSIIGFSEILQGIDELDDKQKRYARNIQKSGRVLLEMINDILDLAKVDAGKMDVTLSEFRIEAIVSAQCDMVRSLSGEKNIDLEVNLPSDLPPLYQDQTKVQQILTNLLSNAIKFTPEGGRIMVTALRRDDGQLEITVADTGVGIPESDRDVIFEKFRQGRKILGEDGLTREYSGTGLGLSIVKELCKLLGGEITFESDLGKGSTFKVTLPWSSPAHPARAAQISQKLNELQRSHVPAPHALAESAAVFDEQETAASSNYDP